MAMWTVLTYEVPEGKKYNVLEVAVDIFEHDASFDHAFGTEKRVEYETVMRPLAYYDENTTILPVTPAVEQWVADNYEKIKEDALNKLKL